MLGLWMKSFGRFFYFKMNLLVVGIILVLISEIKSQEVFETSYNDSKIIGGLVIKISDAPYQASLAHKSIFICGASIISTRYLITAAHCKIIKFIIKHI